LTAAAKAALDSRGYGMSSVRFICGTQDIHKTLERKISAFFKTDDTILYAACFKIKPTQSAICAVMIYEAGTAQDMAERLLEEGIYVIGFSYPVVPEGQARIRVQLSAAHETGDLGILSA
jgi:glycine C-acetyltransferase